jgi:hypothetical protein
MGCHNVKPRGTQPQKDHFVYPYIVSLVFLRNFCMYFIFMTDKAR